MLIVDDLLLAPASAFFYLCKEIHKAARAEMQDTRPVLQELQELYMRLETGKITEQDFNAQEKLLLDRLERAEQDERNEQQGQDGQEGQDLQDGGEVESVGPVEHRGRPVREEEPAG